MNTTDIDALWKEAPKVEGAIGDDGDYNVTFSEPHRRFVSGGLTALIEFPFTVNQGDSKGVRAKSTVFYITNDEPNQKGLDLLKKIADQVDPMLRGKSKFNESLEAIEALMPGRTGRINQNTYNEKVYFNILEIDSSIPNLESDTDIPF